ncbi:MAG TPA: flavodoxin [Euryarchaeota archaeon]|nr:flavodoxin [Euryarchaeota archaeon]
MTNSAVVYQSIHHNNTKMVAHAIAKQLDADLFTPGMLKKGDLDAYSLVGFGSGIYFFKHHQNILTLADSLIKPGFDAFVFSTRGGGPPSIYHMLLKRKLRSKGVDILGDYSTLALDTYAIWGKLGGLNHGRPDEKDLKRAQEFACAMKKRHLDKQRTHHPKKGV